MPLASDLLKKHAKRVSESPNNSSRIQRKGPTRPWQENLDRYADQGQDSLVENANEPKSPEVIYESQKSSRDAIDEAIIVDCQDELTKFNSPQSEISKEATNQKAVETKKLKKESTTIVVPSEDETLQILSDLALSYSIKIRKFGFDLAMKILLINELANSDGIIHCSQLYLANHLGMSLKSIKRLFDDLCEIQVIELIKESDPKTKSPRQYRLL